jgi:hypothetical protein
MEKRGERKMTRRIRRKADGVGSLADYIVSIINLTASEVETISELFDILHHDDYEVYDRKDFGIPGITNDKWGWHIHEIVSGCLAGEGRVVVIFPNRNYVQPYVELAVGIRNEPAQRWNEDRIQFVFT